METAAGGLFDAVAWLAPDDQREGSERYQRDSRYASVQVLISARWQTYGAFFRKIHLRVGRTRRRNARDLAAQPAVQYPAGGV